VKSLPTYIWITGASSGIGKALALQYSKRNTHLILSARRSNELEEVADLCRNNGSKADILPLDISKTEELKSVVDSLKQTYDRIDLLINNAGISQRSKVLDTQLSADRKLFEINYFGTIELTRNVLSWMVEKGGGKLAVISSISGKFGFPLRSSYAASKHALQGYFETIDLEYRHEGIDVSIISPGRIKTPISMSALKGDGSPSGTMDEGLRNGMDADKCARRIVRAIDKRRLQTLIGGKEILLYYIHKFSLPLFRKIASKVNPR
jgi:short-subunit dehydrogenase